MRAFQITIVHPKEAAIYAGHYHTAANAVFGAMRKFENDLYKDTKNCFFKDIEYQRVRKILNSELHITVSPTHSSVPKKVHRIA